jgi:hypothetical protein
MYLCFFAVYLVAFFPTSCLVYPSFSFHFSDVQPLAGHPSSIPLSLPYALPPKPWGPHIPPFLSPPLTFLSLLLCFKRNTVLTHPPPFLFITLWLPTPPFLPFPRAACPVSALSPAVSPPSAMRGLGPSSADRRALDRLEHSGLNDRLTWARVLCVRLSHAPVPTW